MSVTTALDLLIKRQGTGLGSFAEQIEVVADSNSKTLSIKYLIGITVAVNADPSSSFAVNTVATYHEHIRTPSDASLTGALVYEAVLAHERGHATYAITETQFLLHKKTDQQGRGRIIAFRAEPPYGYLYRSYRFDQ